MWEDFDNATGTDQAYISTSSDGGANWSAAALVNSAAASRPAYTPSVAIAPDGTVGVTYYQWDNAPSSGLEPTVLYIQKSTSAGSSTTAPVFGARTAVSTEFNGLAAPFLEGYFLGDYEGLAANTSGFIPFKRTHELQRRELPGAHLGDQARRPDADEQELDRRLRVPGILTGLSRGGRTRPPLRILGLATMRVIDRIRQWLSRPRRDAETAVEGGEPVATPPTGSFGEPERETSTDAQMQGARDEPWPDSR